MLLGIGSEDFDFGRDQSEASTTEHEKGVAVKEEVVTLRAYGLLHSGCTGADNTLHVFTDRSPRRKDTPVRSGNYAV